MTETTNVMYEPDYTQEDFKIEIIACKNSIKLYITTAEGKDKPTYFQVFGVLEYAKVSVMGMQREHNISKNKEQSHD